MYTKQPKKGLILYILETLKNHTDEMPDEVTAKVRVNIEAHCRWALQYALHVKILSPQFLANAVKQDLEEALNGYTEKA